MIGLHLEITFNISMNEWVPKGTLARKGHLVLDMTLICQLEKCRVIGHNPHFSSLCSLYLSCLNPKELPKGI